MSGSLDGRKALVTGASSGIGEATAVAFARAGAEVSVGARRKDRLDGLVERISEARRDGSRVRGRRRDEAAARSFVEGAAEAMGGVDVLVNNAGVMLLGPVDGADTDEWRRMIDVNLLGLLYCTHAALPIMGEGGRGPRRQPLLGRRSHAPSLGGGVYNMTKWGVVGFSEALRQEALHSNVRVTCVEPGFVETELQGHNKNPMVVEAIEKMREQIGDVLEADDIANAIVYAVSQPDHVALNEILIRPTKQQR